MYLSGNISLIRKLKVTKNQCFTLSLKNEIFETPLEKVLLASPEFLELKLKFVVIKTKSVLKKHNDGVNTC